MKTYENINELIYNLPKFMIPYDFFDIYLYIKLLHNSEYHILIPENVILNLKKMFGDLKNPNNNFLKRKKEFNDYLKEDTNFRFFRSGKILYYDTEIPDNMIQCENCGNIWDGNAQCNCYLYNNEYGELEYI